MTSFPGGPDHQKAHSGFLSEGASRELGREGLRSSKIDIRIFARRARTIGKLREEQITVELARSRVQDMLLKKGLEQEGMLQVQRDRLLKLKQIVGVEEISRLGVRTGHIQEKKARLEDIHKRVGAVLRRIKKDRQPEHLKED